MLQIAISPFVQDMGTIDRVVFLENAVETLGYFSRQLALEMQRFGLHTYFVDYEDMYETLDGLTRFAVKGKTALCTFNFIGLSGEDIFLREGGGYLWEDYEMQYLNILVDHPLYFHSKLERTPSGMRVFCVDREHVGYIRRFYPQVDAEFLPLAGNRLWGEQLPISAPVPYGRRRYDVVFTANYVALPGIYRRFDALETEYRAFYRGIVEDLIASPTQPLAAAIERHTARELGELSDMDMRSVMAGMGLVDLCVRAYFRDAIIRELAEADVRVHVFGEDWKLFCCKKQENVIRSSGRVRSVDCVQAMREAKIALNIMPWFKDGAHDRVFTAMLQGAVALTDGSGYLREEFEDGGDIAFFSLEETGGVPDTIRMLLAEEDRAEQIAERGYQKARGRHTWGMRAAELVKYFE